MSPCFGGLGESAEYGSLAFCAAVDHQEGKRQAQRDSLTGWHYPPIQIEVCASGHMTVVLRRSLAALFHFGASAKVGQLSRDVVLPRIDKKYAR